MEVAGANRRWRCQFRCRGSRRESAVAQLFSLGGLRISNMEHQITFLRAFRDCFCIGLACVSLVKRASASGQVLWPRLGSEERRELLLAGFTSGEDSWVSKWAFSTRIIWLFMLAFVVVTTIVECTHLAR